MATTDAEHLTLINTVITRRMNGDGYEEYSEKERKFAGTPLSELYKVRDQLQKSVSANSGGNFGLIEPFRD